MDTRLQFAKRRRFGLYLRLPALTLCLVLPCLSISAQPPAPPAAQADPPPVVATEAQKKQIDRLCQSARDFFAKKEFDAAEKAARMGLQAAQQSGDTLAIIDTDYFLGAVLENIGKYAEAEAYYKKALEGYESKRIFNAARAADTNIHLATVAYDQGHFADALEYTRKTLPYYESLPDKSALIGILRNMDSLIQDIHREKENIPHLEEALELRAKYGTKAEHIRGISMLAKAYVLNAEYIKLEKISREGYVLAREIGDSVNYGGMTIALVSALVGQQKWDEAETVFDTALPFLQKNRQHIAISAAASALSICFHALGNSDKAQKYDKIIEEMRSYIHNAPQVAVIHFQQAMLLIAQHKMPEAQAEMEAGGKTAETDMDRAFEHECKMQWYIANHDDAKAEPEFNSALDAFKKLGVASSIFSLIANRGTLYLRLGKYAAAQAEFEKSLSQELVVGNPFLSGSVHISLGEVACCQKDYDRANRELETAANSYAYLYDTAGDPAYIGVLQQFNASNLFGLWAFSLWKQGRPMAALLTAERGQAKGLQIMLNGSKADLAALPKPARQAWQDAQAAAQQEFTQEEILRQSPDMNAKDSTVRSAAEKQYRESLAQWEILRTALRTKQISLRRQYPAFQQIAGTELTERMLKKMSRQRADTLFLEMVIVDDSSTLVFALHAGSLHVFPVAVGDAGWLTAAGHWRKAMKNYALLNSTNLDYKQYGFRLRKAEADEKAALSVFSRLIAPVERAGMLQEKGLKHLVFVANATLAGVPFCALADRKGKPLVQRFGCSNSLSLALLCRSEAARKPTAGMLCLANPAVAPPAVPVHPAAPEQTVGTSRPLAVLEKSARDIARLFGGCMQTGPKANHAAALEMNRYALLFFGVHGILDTEDGLRSFLQMAYDPAKSKAEHLEAQEIMNMRLNADLTVLASCDAADGEQASGEGLQGLAWSFQAAHCGAVIAPLWSVQERATAMLMTKLFQGLRQGRRKDEALRQAMLAVSANKEFAAPYFWAGFQLFGDTQSLPARYTSKK